MHRFARFYVVLVMTNCHAFLQDTGSQDDVKSRKRAAHHHLQSRSLLSLHNKSTKQHTRSLESIWIREGEGREPENPKKNLRIRLLLSEIITRFAGVGVGGKLIDVLVRKESSRRTARRYHPRETGIHF